MARIRSVKPELFTSVQVGRVSHSARFFFVGLFTQADKLGRIEWQPERLRALLFPYDVPVVDVEALAAELVSAKLVRFYDAGDAWVLEIPKFVLHQRPHPKEAESRLPAPPTGETFERVPWPVRATHEMPVSVRMTTEPANYTASREITESIPSSPAGKGREGDLGREGGEFSPSQQGRSALMMSPAQYDRLSKRNAFVGSRLIVPLDLHAELRGRLGGPEADAQLRAWYAALNIEIDGSGEEIKPTVWKWLDTRYQAWRANHRAASAGDALERQTEAWRAEQAAHESTRGTTQEILEGLRAGRALR